MNKCDCDCHKKTAWSDLKRCEDKNKKKLKEIVELKRKLIVATLVIAVGGTLLGKEALDSILEYLQTYDKVKSTIDGVTHGGDGNFEISPPVYYGSSPAPGTAAVFLLWAMIPTRRRR